MLCHHLMMLKWNNTTAAMYRKLDLNLQECFSVQEVTDVTRTVLHYTVCVSATDFLSIMWWLQPKETNTASGYIKLSHFYIFSLISIGLKNYLEKRIFYIDLHWVNNISHIQTPMGKKEYMRKSWSPFTNWFAWCVSCIKILFNKILSS